MTTVACVGSRSLSPWLRTLCESFGSFYAERGIRVATGNAPGADQAFALGASIIDPSLVDLYLPWLGFEERAITDGNRIYHAGMATEEHIDLARKAHPQWHKLSDGSRKLLTRNAMIVRGLEGAHVSGMVAVPNRSKPGYGGTGHAMRAARLLGISVYLLPEREVW